MRKNKRNTTEIKMFNRLICTLAGCLWLLFPVCSQEIRFYSPVLDQDRIISIHLPANFDSLKAYPTIFVLDGERIGKVVSGINDYLATCERTMPSIVVAIHQDSLRWKDCAYKASTSELTTTGKKFHTFLQSELISYVNSHYKTTGYMSLVGHSFTATFLYLELLKGEISFNSYIALSPYLPVGLQLKVKALQKIPALIPDLFTVTASNDLSGHRQSIAQFQKRMSKEQERAVAIDFRNFAGKSHLTLVPSGVEEGLNFIFRDYSSLNSRYLLSKKIPVISKPDLLDYYRKMEEKYRVHITIRTEDIEFALFTLTHHRKWDQLKELAEWAITSVPEHYCGYYGMGTYLEHLKIYDQSLEYFQKGYDCLGEDVLNKADFYKDIERVRSKKSVQ